MGRRSRSRRLGSALESAAAAAEAAAHRASELAVAAGEQGGRLARRARRAAALAARQAAHAAARYEVEASAAAAAAAQRESERAVARAAAARAAALRAKVPGVVADRRRGPGRRLLLLTAVGAGAYAARRRAAARAALPPAPPVPPPVVPPGAPRLVLPARGSVPHGTPQARGVGSEVPLHVGELVVGRERGVDLRLRDTSVSPRHAAVVASASGGVTVRDLGSLNGVRVDGVPRATADLHHGNRIQLGDAVLIFQQDARAEDGGRQGGELGELGSADRP